MCKRNNFINKTLLPLFFFYFLRDPVPFLCIIDNKVYEIKAYFMF